MFSVCQYGLQFFQFQIKFCILRFIAWRVVNAFQSDYMNREMSSRLHTDRQGKGNTFLYNLNMCNVCKVFHI